MFQVDASIQIMVQAREGSRAWTIISRLRVTFNKWSKLACGCNQKQMLKKCNVLGVFTLTLGKVAQIHQ